MNIPSILSTAGSRLATTLFKNTVNGQAPCRGKSSRSRRPRLRPWRWIPDVEPGPPSHQLRNETPTKLQFRIKRWHRNLHGAGQEGRLNKIRRIVNALFRYERIEGKWFYLDESRAYAERLIHEAIVHGDCHKKTMEMANWWLTEKDLIHKLFKVYAPRFLSYSCAFTSHYMLPFSYPGNEKMSVLELKGNPYPPVIPHKTDNSQLLSNILIAAMKEDYRNHQKLQLLEQAKLDDGKSAATISLEENLPTDLPKTGLHDRRKSKTVLDLADSLTELLKHK